MFSPVPSSQVTISEWSLTGWFLLSRIFEEVSISELAIDGDLGDRSKGLASKVCRLDEGHLLT